MQKLSLEQFIELMLLDFIEYTKNIYITSIPQELEKYLKIFLNKEENKDYFYFLVEKFDMNDFFDIFQNTLACFILEYDCKVIVDEETNRFYLTIKNSNQAFTKASFYPKPYHTFIFNITTLLNKLWQDDTYTLYENYNYQNEKIRLS